MPLFYQHTINDSAKIGVWHIAEDESFFLAKVPLQKEITHWHKRLQHLAGRYLLQELYPDFPYHLVEIADTRKPFLPNEEYHFSISHCGDYAAVIVSRNERVGVDIELITPKIEKIKHKFLNEEELENIDACQQPVAGMPADQYLSLLTLFWCCKEAMFKWYGLGNIDFKKQLNIKAINWYWGNGIAHCKFVKEKEIDLLVRFLFLDGNCLSWILTSSMQQPLPGPGSANRL